MITISDLNGIEDNYAWWLNIMPDEMPRLSILPKEIRAQLDYSLDSLDVIEEYIVSNYSVEELKDRKNKFARDLFVRYIGETFRKNVPELFWAFESENRKDAYYGIPVLMTMTEGAPPMTPTLWVTELPGQKGGNFLRSRLKLAKAA
ncbi:MAG TPA: hypothetical protein VG605_17615 [Puia sp.]|jgi:hypothetical protein|nr:hypothetical protein [Puia sp.]